MKENVEEEEARGGCRAKTESVFFYSNLKKDKRWGGYWFVNWHKHGVGGRFKIVGLQFTYLLPLVKNFKWVGLRYFQHPKMGVQTRGVA